MNAVPFSLEVYGGLGECNGLLKDEENLLSLEFQTQDAVAGVLKSDIKHVEIPLDDLVSIGLTKGWLGTKVSTSTVLRETAGISEYRRRRQCKRLREEDAKRWTQKAVAEVLGVSRETVRDWENIPNGGTAKWNKPNATVKVT